MAVLGAGVAAAPLMSACGGGPSAETGGSPTGPSGGEQRFNVQLNWINTVQFGGFFYAVDAGLYDEEGIVPELKAKGGNTDPVNVVAAGSALIGMTSGQDAITARSRGIPIVAFGAQFQKSPGALVSLTEKNITSAEDLVGRRIGIQTTAQTSILGILEVNNIDKDDVTLVTVGSDPSVLVRDQVDVLTSFATNQPVALQQQGYDVNVLSYSDLGRQEYDGVFVSTEENYEKEKESLTAFIRASQAGWNYTLANIDEVAKLVVDKYGESLELEPQVLELEAMAPLLTSPETEADGMFAMADEVWSVTQDNLLSAEQIDEAVDLDDLVKKDVIENA